MFTTMLGSSHPLIAIAMAGDFHNDDLSHTDACGNACAISLNPDPLSAARVFPIITVLTVLTVQVSSTVFVIMSRS